MENTRSPAQDNLVHGFPKRNAPPPTEPDRTQALAADPEIPAVRREWFAGYADRSVLPLLRHAVEAVKEHRLAARCWLENRDGELCALLEIVPPNLPEKTHPPRLTIAAAAEERLLSINYAGMYPDAANNGFGDRIESDTLLPSALEPEILDFIVLATRA